MRKNSKAIRVIKKYPFEDLGIFMSQREVARALNINEGTVSRWVSGARKPKDYVLEVVELEN